MRTSDDQQWLSPSAGYGNGERVTYDDIRGNAFYCGGKNDDYIASDAAFLLPKRNKSFGTLTPRRRPRARVRPRRPMHGECRR
jgi:hypothetical protein